MAYPDKNTSTYIAPSKNSASFSMDGISGLLITEALEYLLTELGDYLIIESGWEYQSKN